MGCPWRARRRFWVTGRSGLITDDRAASLRDFQVPYARPASEVAGWSSQGDGISLADIVQNAEPNADWHVDPAGRVHRADRQADGVQGERPIIMPLSNPTSKCEALPSDLIQWTEDAPWWRLAVVRPDPPTRVGSTRSRRPTTR